MLGLIDIYISYQFPKAGGKVRSGWTHRPFRSPAVATKAPHAMPLPCQHASTSVPLQAGPTCQPPLASNLELINSRGGGRWCSSPAAASSPLTHPPVRHPPLCPPRESETTYTAPPVPGQAKAKSRAGQVPATARRTGSQRHVARRARRQGMRAPLIYPC